MAVPLRAQPTPKPAPFVRGANAEAGAGPPTVVLLALDGVRWEDVFLGVEADLAEEQGLAPGEVLSARELMPNLHALIETTGTALGAPERGHGVFVAGPEPFSLPGYLELLTSRKDTGCTTNGCAPTTLPTLADDFRAQSGPDDVAVISSWEGIERASARDPSAIIVSTGRSRGSNLDRLRYDPQAAALLDAGAKSGPTPGHGDFRRDKQTAEIALRYLAVRKPHFLFLGLGETDEYAHRDDYRGYLKALQHGDAVIGRVLETLHDLRREGRRTTLFVTTDHGRAAEFIRHGGDAPESARVWLVAAGHGIAARGLAATEAARTLVDLSQTIRHVGDLPPRGGGTPLVELLEDEAARVATR